jgi:hypothetical protein
LSGSAWNNNDSRVLMLKSCIRYTVYEAAAAIARTVDNASGSDTTELGAQRAPTPTSTSTPPRLPGVLLLSDDIASVQQVAALLPRAMLVSSPLTATRNSSTVAHMDMVQSLSPDAVARGTKDTVAELLLLSSCDALVHTESGFSKVAGQWGGLPRGNVRQVDAVGEGSGCKRRPVVCSGNDDARLVPTLCASHAYTADYHCREQYWHQDGHPNGGPEGVPASVSSLWCR